MEKNIPLSMRLKGYREAKKMSVRSIAEALDVPKTTYREWEEGRKISNHDALIKLSEILEIPLFELLTGRKVDIQNYLEPIEMIERQVHLLKAQIFHNIR